jgi:hypothetical protein
MNVLKFAYPAQLSENMVQFSGEELIGESVKFMGKSV